VLFLSFLSAEENCILLYLLMKQNILSLWLFFFGEM